MSTASKRLSSQEYLALERQAEVRSEFFDGEMFAMSGASFEHGLIKDNLARETGYQLKGGACLLITSDLRVTVHKTGLYTYPDLVIVCDKPEFEDGCFDTLLNPRIIVEVLSDSTEKYDRGRKFRHYQEVPSIQEYILISQNEFLIERYARQPDGSWLLKTFKDRFGSFDFGTIPVKVSFAEIYSGVPPERMISSDSDPA